MVSGIGLCRVKRADVAVARFMEVYYGNSDIQGLAIRTWLHGERVQEMVTHRRTLNRDESQSMPWGVHCKWGLRQRQLFLSDRDAPHEF